MDPNAASAALGAIPAGMQFGMGLQQMAASKKARRKRPTYERPGEATEMLSLARIRATKQKLPGQDLLEQKYGASTANVMKHAQKTNDPNAFLQSVATASGAERNAMGNVHMAAASENARLNAELMNALQSSAQYSDKEFAYNKDQPYQQAAAASSALKEAGLTNIHGGVSGMAGMASTTLGPGGGDKSGGITTPGATNSGPAGAAGGAGASALMKGTGQEGPLSEGDKDFIIKNRPELAKMLGLISL